MFEFSWIRLFVASEWLIRLAMLPVVLLRQRRPQTCLAWLTLLFFEPHIGLFAYLLIGENRLGRRRLLRRRQELAAFTQSDPRPEATAPRPLLSAEHAAIVQLAEKHGDAPIVGCNHVDLMSDTDAVIAKLIDDIDAATHHAHLLFYIYQDDAVGRRVAEALRRAAARGVACRLLVDAVGSRRMLRRLAPELRRAGVQVVAALPASFLRASLARLDLRNHRKLAILDGRVAYLGSQNIVEADYGHKHAGAWRDCMVRVQGPALSELQLIFLEDWFHDTDELIRDPAYYPDPGECGPSVVQVVPTGPDRTAESFEDIFVQAIHGARRRVVITSPYFVPTEAMFSALRAAATRDVIVQIIVPSRTDHRIVDLAGAFHCARLAEHGAQVHHFAEGLLHSKTMTIDSTFALLGTANFDVRSFDLNFELTLLLYDRATVENILALQETYLRQSVPWPREAWESPSFWQRLARNSAKLVSPLL